MTLIIDKTAIDRVNTLRTQKGTETLFLRVRVEGGGCSGFQYKLELTENAGEQEQVFDNAVISDDISLGFLDGAKVIFEESLIGAEFKIVNPNATAGCGCGTSFSMM